MSPLALSSLITAVIFTVVKLFIVVAETAAHQTVITAQAGGCITIGAIVGWVTFFTAHCRDSLADKVTGHSSQLAGRVHDYIDTAVSEHFDRFSTELHVANRAADRAAKRTPDDFGVPTPPPRRPHLVP